eukprot:IDg11435t1
MVSLNALPQDATAKAALQTVLACKGDRKAAAADFVKSVANVHAALAPSTGVIELLNKTLSGSDKKKVFERDAALQVVKALVATYGPAVMPSIVALLPNCLVLASDKSGKNLQNLAVEVASSIVTSLNPTAMRALALPHLINACNSQSKWQTQAAAL